MTMEWSVEYTLRGLPSEDALMTLQERYDHKGIDASVAAIPDFGQWTVSFGYEYEDGDYLDPLGRSSYELKEIGEVDTSHVVAVQVLTVDELERRASRPTMPQLIGSSEVGDILRVSRQRVHQLRDNPGFPRPLVEVAMGPLWDERAVEKFAREWQRKPGRPASDHLDG
jgi:hypothetical protein